MSGDIAIGGKVAQLKKFDPKTLVYDENGNFLNPRVCMIAASGSGKSYVLRDMLYHMRDVPVCTVIAPTDKMNKFYDDFVPKSFIHHEYNERIIPKILKRQMSVLELNEKRVKQGKKPIDPRLVFIMDDCMATKHLWKKDPNVLTIMNQGRHYQLSYFLTMQYSLGLEPELRSNFNFIFLLGEDIKSNRDRLYQHFAGCFPTRDLFEQVFISVTANYGCLVINNRIKSPNFMDKVFWYRAERPPSFVIGIPKAIKWNKENYDPQHEKRGALLDINDFIGGKRRTIVNVQMI
jgi:hypothetical protein